MHQQNGIAKTVGVKLWLEIIVATVVFLTTMAFILFIKPTYCGRGF